MNIAQLYAAKRCSIESALAFIRSGDLVFTAQAGAEPVELLEQLHTIAENGVRGVEVQNCYPVRNYRYIADPSIAEAIFIHSWYYTPPVRAAHAHGNVTFTPQHAHRAVVKKLSGLNGRRMVLLCSCSPMDKHGYLSLSISNVYERDLIDHGALVICEVNPHRPRTFGDNLVHISEVTALVEAGYEIPAASLAPFSPNDAAIGARIAELVEDGSTIQLGVGNIPNAAAEALKVRRHLGIHTEMFTETMIDLIQCGAVDNSQKTLCPGRSVCAFAFGSRRLYDYLDDNPSVLFKSGSWVNDPYVIAQNDNFVSINATIEIDLTGQCASESFGPRQYTGSGGQADTVLGALRSRGGKSVIAMNATAEVHGDGSVRPVSKIVPMLRPGAVVTLSRNDVDYVVTEYGTAWLRGLSVRDRVRALIGIAHPDFRDWLASEAKRHQIW
ncbi:MAG: acetyl-CoA hydrolase/transferase family protein [Solirubrobacterales bacterium]